MASVCVNNAGVSPAGYGWSSREERCSSSSLVKESDTHQEDPVVDFEFCLEDPVKMLSADELFSDGKLVPLKFSGSKTEPQASPEVLKPCRRLEMEISDLFSPKAPRCTTRWRELLGLKRLVKAHDSVKMTTSSSSSSSSSRNLKTPSFKQFLHRGSKSSSTASSPSPLLKESDVSESISIASSRLSLSSSSSSSGHEIDDLPRLSLDLDKPSPNPFAPSRTHLRNPNHPRIRSAKPRRPSNSSADGSSNMTAGEPRGVTVTADSPRLNASGKIVFHGLERSSSSPGSFTGGPRMKQHHGMPRSYSANVRITPVLNVPVSSLKSGLFFGQLFSSSSSSSSASSSSSLSSPSPGNKSQLQSNGKNRTNRTRLEPKCEQ
ncbi:hypothetical protein EUTSA_v10012288mg [Eutrema salsugineum]|uniref:Uncharacterized protein n=1 Tax=Eutrema salsugineum TaxID=72664 RepID=V4KR70_EUTSA|nr:putative protein TPRXL [Eutrema salsugineum]ESQ29863.1 hypothetical protein EUTSA_v10012288mg [Eutrema salsugineum]